MVAVQAFDRLPCSIVRFAGVPGGALRVETGKTAGAEGPRRGVLPEGGELGGCGLAGHAGAGGCRRLIGLLVVPVTWA